MNESIDRAVNRVIELMYTRVGDDLTVDELARAAMYSKFHFSRAFRRVTGVSPGRFLSTLRFQEAKRLLTDTSMSVAEISNHVGYSSLGTFSTRFKQSVGSTPTEYRRSGGRHPTAGGNGHRSDPHGRSATLQGRITAGLSGTWGPTFVGLFPGAVPHESPVTSTVLAHPGPYVLENVPEGTWYLLAHGMVGAGDNGDAPANPVGSVGCRGPIHVHTRGVVGVLDVQLRPMRAVDLPLLPAPFVARPEGVGRCDRPTTVGHARPRVPRNV